MSTIQVSVSEVEPVGILEPTRILVKHDVYVPISELKPNDTVISARTKKPIKIIKIGYDIVTPESVQPNNVPFVVKKNIIDGEFPVSDLYLSGYHSIINTTFLGERVAINTFKLYYAKKVPFESPTKYYYIFVENGDPIFAEGLIVESTE